MSTFNFLNQKRQILQSQLEDLDVRTRFEKIKARDLARIARKAKRMERLQATTNIRKAAA
jgi:hypothetical protein